MLNNALPDTCTKLSRGRLCEPEVSEVVTFHCLALTLLLCSARAVERPCSSFALSQFQEIIGLQTTGTIEALCYRDQTNTAEHQGSGHETKLNN